MYQLIKMYRIKTFKEFGNKRPSLWNDEGKMDYLYGLLLTDKQAEYLEVPRQDDLTNFTWTLRREQLVKLEGFTEKPTDVKVGDQFIIVKEYGIETSNKLPKGLEIGDIVTLYKQDSSIRPGFTYDALGDDYSFLNWGYMTYYYGSVDSLITPTEKQVFKAGDTVKLNKDTEDKWGSFRTQCNKILDKVFILNSEQAKELNEGEVTLLTYNGKCNYFKINFLPKWLEIINPTDMEDFKEGEAYPDEKEGTIYRVKVSGRLVSLKRNDGTYNPYFWNEDKSDYHCMKWTKLERVENSELVPFPSHEARPQEVNGTEYVLVEKFNNYAAGTIVTLCINDGTPMPCFTFPDGHTTEVYWKRLAPITANVDKPVSANDNVIGNTFKVINTKENEYYRSGDIVEYKQGGGSQAPLFLNTRTGKEVFINWKRLVIHSVNNLNLNLNITNNGKESHTIEPVLSRISSTISYGSAPRGVELQSSRSKIQLGG